MPSPAISVVVVNWNGRERTARCLGSLRAQTDRDFEIVVVDNASTDDSRGMLRAEFPEVRLVESARNEGFAGGANRGIEAARGEWVATLNNDALADPGWIRELRRIIERADSRLGMIQSRIVFDDRRDRTNSTGVLISSTGSPMDRDFDAPLRDTDVDEPIFCASAGAALYRRAMLDSVRLSSGYFDEGFFMYFEDVDLGWRARLAGWDALYAPQAIVFHEFQGTAKTRGPRFVQLHCLRNRLRTLVKNASLAMLWRGAWASLRDIWELTRFEGAGAMGPIVRGLVHAAHDRRKVSSISRVSRREVEQRWFGVG